MQSRVGILEQALLSGEGGAIEEQIVLTLVKKGVIDCENSTQCDDDKACMDSMKERGRMLCEPVCERLAFMYIMIFQRSSVFNIYLSDWIVQSDIQNVLVKIMLHLVNVKKDSMEMVLLIVYQMVSLKKKMVNWFDMCLD